MPSVGTGASGIGLAAVSPAFGDAAVLVHAHGMCRLPAGANWVS